MVATEVPKRNSRSKPLFYSKEVPVCEHEKLLDRQDFSRRYFKLFAVIFAEKWNSIGKLGQRLLVSLKLDMRRLEVKVQSPREGYSDTQFSRGAVLSFAIGTWVGV